MRLLDWLAILVDVAKLPSVARDWEELQAARESAYTMPWSHAILRVLELEEYQALPEPRAGWIAGRLGIPLEEEQRCLELLARTRQVRKDGKHWVVDRSRLVDTRTDPERSRQVKDWWTRVALERIQAGDGLVFAYNLFSLSSTDLVRVRQAFLAFYEQMRTIVADSQPNQEVVLFTVQMVPLLPARGPAIA